MCHQEEFLTLSAAKLVELTGSDELEVDKEEAVFQAVARWYNNKPDARKSEFCKVLCSYSFLDYLLYFCFVILIFTYVFI